MIAEPGCCSGRRARAGLGGTPDEDAALASADTFLRRGLDLKRWWDQAWATNSFAQKFLLTTSFDRPDESFGFFDVAQVEGREMPIMGNYQAMFYDQPKSPTASKAVAAQWMRDQIRQFALRYFMRVSSFRLPEAFIPRSDRQPIPDFLRPLSWCPEEDPKLIGFGFDQILYKLAGSGRIGAFPETDREAIVDLREIGPRFEWILPYVHIFNFNFTVQPFGPGTPSFSIPLKEGSYLIMNRDFVVNEEEPSPGLLGRYGFGYSFIKNPEPSIFAFGPGEFDAAIEIIQWLVDKEGKIRCEAIFVVNRPTRIANVSLNPFDWGYGAANLLTLGTSRYLLAPVKRALDMLPGSDLSFDPVTLSITTANLLTGGLAARDFCISLKQLERDFLVTHFQQHHQTLLGSLETWRQIPNWLDTEALPEWVITGRSHA
ncbi:MAG TPA: hypothetical protein VF756_16580 [Thermoanaerobaculia bacterium]